MVISSTHFKIVFVLLLLFVVPAQAQNKTMQDTVANGIYAEVEKIFAHQKQIHEEDSIKKAVLQGRLQLSEGEEAIRLMGEIDTLEKNDSIAKAQLAEKLELIKTSVMPLPVAPFHDTLFYLHANLFSIPACR